MADNDGSREIDPAVIAPKIGADAKRLKEWVEGGLTYSNRFRCDDAARWRRAELYDDNKQWLKKAATGYDAPGSYSQWMTAGMDPSSPDWIPMPVINEGRGVLSNEAAQLSKPNYRPTVVPKEDDIEARLGAQAARDLIKWRLRDMDWPAEGQLFYYRMPLHGGVWVRSSWIKSWDKTSPSPVQNAVSCAQHKTKGGECDFVLSDPMMKGEEANRLPTPAPGTVLEAEGEATESIREVPSKEPGGPMGFQAFRCPTCPNHPPLTKHLPSMEEAAQGNDSVGRRLGRDLPIGDWWMRVLSPYDVFPRDLGFNMNWLDVDEWTEVEVVTLDAIAMLYPEKAGQVRPESPSKLAEFHPIVGSPQLYGGSDTKLFRNCTRKKSRFKKPWMERQDDGTYQMNQGRKVVMAGEVVLEDGPLMIESLTKKGEFIETDLVVFVPWEFLDGGRRLSGFSIWDLMFDPQDGLNECVSQEQNIRQRCAVPFILAARSHNLETAANTTGIAGRFVTFDIDATAPEQAPRMMNNETAPSGIADEAGFYRDEIGRLPGRAAVERGEVPSNAISAASAIENLKTYVSETRQPRLERIKAAFKKCWSHGLQLMAALYLEPRPVRIEDEDGEERWKMLQGLDLKGQTDVEVEADPDYDTEARNRALTNDFIDKKLIDPTDPRMARIVAKIFDAPPELFRDANLQEDQAQREWIAFRDRGEIPVRDPILDDDTIHRECHAEAATTETFRKMAQGVGWREKVLPVLAPLWDQLKFQAQSMPAQPMKPVLDPATQQPIMGKPTLDPQTNTVMPAQQIMEPAGPPVTLQRRLIQTWMLALLQAKAIQMQDEEGMKPLLKVMAWQAHMVVHEIEAQNKQAAVQSGAMVAAAPGTPDVGGTGMEPTMGEAQQQEAMGLTQ